MESINADSADSVDSAAEQEPNLAQTIDASCQLKPVSIRTRHIVHIVVALPDWLFSVDVQVEPPTPIPARRSARNSAGDVADWIEVNWLSWIGNGTE